MRVIWYGTEAECAAALELINANFRIVATGAGYTLDGSGSIVGKDGEGMDRFDGQTTTTWDVPHYDPQSDRWWIADPATRLSDVVGTMVVAHVAGERGEFTPAPELPDDGA